MELLYPLLTLVHATGFSLWWRGTALLSLALFFLLTSCLPASAPPTLKLGLVAPFSGRDQALGYNMLFAAKLALKERNERGGVGGHYVELVAQDDGNQAKVGALQARKMALDPQVVGVVGHPSAESALAAAPIYREAGLPVILTGINLSDGKGEPPVFHLGLTGRQLAQAAAAFAAAQAFRRLAIVAEAMPLDQGIPLATGWLPGETGPDQELALAVDQAAAEAGLKVVLERVIKPGRVGAGAIYELPLLEQLKGSQPDLVFYSGGYVEGGELLAAMRAQGLETPFLGGPGLASPDFLKIAGPAAEGAYHQSVAPHPKDVAAARSFVEAFRALAGIDPRPQALLVYDGVNAILEGLRRGLEEGQRPGRDALWRQLAQGSYSGLNGPLSFDGYGKQEQARGYIYRIEGMAWPGRSMR